MARKINSRLRICGILRAETPLHVGGYGIDVDTDLPLARNGKNELYVPGTSITGVLRAWCENNFNKSFIKEIFGFQEIDKNKVGTNQDKSHASFILIEDAVVTLPKNLQTEIRDGVGIDRVYGTAADKSKFDRAILPKSSMLRFEMSVEIEDRKLKPKDKRKNNQDYDETEEQFENRVRETKAIIGHLLMALSNEEIRFGASKTRGLGRIRLFELHEIQHQDFSKILDWIASDEKGKKLTDETEIETEIKKLGLTVISKQSKPKLEITIKWKPRLPLMVKAGYEGIGVDMLPVTSGVEDGKLSLVLAGSSIKGAFRSQAERIIRTLKNLLTKDEFNEQVKVPLIEELFGTKKEKKSTNPKLGLGALSIDDCYSVEKFDQINWREVEQRTAKDDVSATQWEITSALNKVHSEIQTLQSATNHKSHFHISHHTAIDRFTGGVAEGALYSVLAPHNIEWQPIKMSLDFGRTENDKCCLMLLLLILRDLAENRLPFGFATNRGMGEIEVEWIKLNGTNLIEIGLPKELNSTLTNGDVRQIDSEIKDTLKGAWEEWLNK